MALGKALGKDTEQKVRGKETMNLFLFLLMVGAGFVGLVVAGNMEEAAGEMSRTIIKTMSMVSVLLIGLGLILTILQLSGGRRGE